MSNETKSTLWTLSNAIRGTYFSKDFILVLIRLVFLKYCIDNSIGAESKEDMQICMGAQKAMSKRDPEMLLNSTISVLQYLDRTYGLDEILSSPYNIGEYAEVFGVDVDKQRKSVRAEHYKNAIDVLAGFDFDETGDGAEVGRSLVDALIALFYEYNQRSFTAKESSTSAIINSIASGILNVKPGEVFCDFCSGFGFSTIAITGESLTTIKSIDKDFTVAPLSAMLYIMYGYKDITVLVGDSLSGEVEIPKADKVFVDAPLGTKIPYYESGLKWDCNSIAAEIAIDRCLNDNGIAVITAPGSVLFQSGSKSQQFKEYLILGSYLKAVVALPPLWQGTTVGTNLLVLSKTHVKSPLLINATEEKRTKKNSFGALSSTLSQETVDRIIDLIRNPKDEKGFARVVSPDEIAAKKFNLTPALYMEQDNDDDTITVAEIDSKLNELYKQLLG